MHTLFISCCQSLLSTPVTNSKHKNILIQHIAYERQPSSTYAHICMMLSYHLKFINGASSNFAVGLFTSCRIVDIIYVHDNTKYT